MRQTTRVPTTMMRAIDTKPKLMPTLLTTRLLSIPWWRPTALLHVVQAWMTSVTQRQASVRRDIRPDCPRQEMLVDILARQHPFLYACSFVG
jgi:hypothetical protein